MASTSRTISIQIQPQAELVAIPAGVEWRWVQRHCLSCPGLMSTSTNLWDLPSVYAIVKKPRWFYFWEPDTYDVATRHAKAIHGYFLTLRLLLILLTFHGYNTLYCYHSTSIAHLHIWWASSRAYADFLHRCDLSLIREWSKFSAVGNVIASPLQVIDSP